MYYVNNRNANLANIPILLYLCHVLDSGTACTRLHHRSHRHYRYMHGLEGRPLITDYIDEPVFILQNKQTICSQSAAGPYRQDIQISESQDVLGSHHSV